MGATLLLADDSVTIQRVIELTFADEDIRVLVASDGQQAIQKIDSDRPDIVLADIGMPRVDGYAVAAHVKQTPSLKHIPVLLLTGAFEPVDEARARQTGCDGVLVKPFEPQKLVARVKELLAGSRAAELWPVDMPRTQAEQVLPVPQVQPIVAVQIAAPPLSVPIQEAPASLDELDPVLEPAEDSVFDFSDVVAASTDSLAAVEGEDVANRNGDHAFRQSRPELPPPADRLETELDMLDAALSRLDPTARAHELDEETASDFARDLNELRNEPREDDAENPRPPRPSFGSWDLPAPSTGDVMRAQPIDILAEEVPLVHTPQIPPPPPAPAPPVFVEVAPPAPEPIVHVRVTPPPIVHVPQPVIAPPAVAAPPAITTAPIVSAPSPQVFAPAHPAPVYAEAPAGKPAAPASPAAPVAPIERPTLATAFSALLAAEKSRPVAQAAPPQISEAAIEEVVRRVLARMAGETVNRVVLETAERLIREEISRTKDPSGR